MSEIERLQREEAAILKEWKPLTDRLDAVRREIGRERSKAWIAQHQVRRDQIELSNKPGMPLFSIVWQFVDVLRAKPCRKRFVEWNGMLFRTEDLIAGRWEDTYARLEDVPE